MNKMQSFHCPHSLYQDLISSTQNWLAGEGFKHQKLAMEDGGTLVQIEKIGGWKKVDWDEYGPKYRVSPS